MNTFPHPAPYLRYLSFLLALAPLTLGLVLVAHTPTAQAQEKASSRATLQQRYERAASIYNEALRVANSFNVFNVSGKIHSGDGKRLYIYGRSFGLQGTSNQVLGWNTDDSFLIIHNPRQGSVSTDRYSDVGVALSQNEFGPPPQRYFDAVEVMAKYLPIVESLRAEKNAGIAAQQQAIRKRELANQARAAQALLVQRNSVYNARVALANKEAKALLAQLDAQVAAQSDQGTARLQSSAKAVALYNKWGDLSVNNRLLAERAMEDLVLATTWRVGQNDWKGASEAAHKLLSLNAFGRPPLDAKTGRERTQLGPGEMPSPAVAAVLNRTGAELPVVASLANAWLEKLPAYMASPASQPEKVRVAWLSQLLGTGVWKRELRRDKIIATSVDAVRGEYGPSALNVLPAFAPLVEFAKRERVEKQVAVFRSGPGAPVQPENPIGLQAVQAPPMSDRPEAVPIEKNPLRATVQPLVPAPDFTARSLKTARKMRLSDFAGKTVLLYFMSITDESRDTSPTPAETLFAFSKRYDPNQVVLLLVDEGTAFDYATREFKKMTAPRAAPQRDNPRGRGPRLYPEEVYSLEMGMPRAAGDVPPERVVSEQALIFYTGKKNTAWNAQRVTVINPQQQVVGFTDFKQDLTASGFDGNGTVYDFSENKLEDLMVRAMGLIIKDK